MTLHRAVCALLAAAVVSGAVPQPVYAQVARIAVVETGSMPVAPVGASAASMNMAPALNPGAASLTGSFSAPSIAPSPVANAAVSAAASIPSLNTPSTLPSALAVSPAASASDDRTPEAPKAATPAPAAAKKTWSDRISGWLGRKPAAEKSVEADKLEADKVFDGAGEKKDETAGRPVSGDSKGFSHKVASRLSANVASAQEKRKYSVDEFGGPLAEPMSFRQRVGYGLRQGLNLVGIAAVLEYTLKPLLAIFPWTQYLSDQTLRGFGRVTLLTKFGPDAIQAGLANAPATFLGISLPMAVTMEELSFRLWSFGFTFLFLAAMRPFSRWIASLISGLPDAAGVVGVSKKILKIGDWISHFAFPIAAVYSTFKFAVAHFAAWGISPYVFLLNVVLGLFLAHTAYKSRSLTSPILAHLLFNLVTMGAILLSMTFSPLTSTAFTIVMGLLGVASMYHGWLTNRKERKFRMSTGKSIATALVIALASFGALNSGTTPRPDLATVSAAMRTVQDKTQTAPKAPAVDTTKTAPAPAAADTAKVESRADVVARVKPAVVNPIIHMANGYSLGSGFILTPDGVFITNGHVVGSKKPGEIINARVPDFPMELKAKVLAVNHDKDLAIVQLQPRPDGKPWPTVKLASEAPREGDDVIAIGNPRGLIFSTSHGVISSMDGRGNMYVKHLQTDAAINPGNSGGPLFNMKGEVVGVNTQIYTESGGSEGLGFAIMAPEVASVMAQFKETGNIATAALGISANLSDPEAPEAGLQIEYVHPGSAAEKAGLKRGDLIIGVGDATIEEAKGEGAQHIAAVLSKLRPGQTITVTVLRGDDPQSVEVTLDAKKTVAPSH